MPSDRSDFRFRPRSLDGPSPRTLSPAQVDAWNRDGFVAPLPLFDADEAARNRALFDDLLAQRGAGGAYAINCFQARSRGIWDLCTEPRILDAVEDLIGPDIVCWASHFFCKLPHDPKHVPWHQDAIYWRLAPARTVTAWLAIDDADEENAAMAFLPGSHARGALAWTAAGDGAVLDKAIEGEALDDAAARDAPVSNALRAGEISLHADMLAHGSGPNRSTRRRCGLTVRYCPPEVRATDEAWRRGLEPILCRGEDRSGHWRHHPRPSRDDIRGVRAPHDLGGN